MKNELCDIIKSENFLEYKRLENKLWNYDENIGCVLGVLGYVIFLVTLMVKFFPIDDFGDFFLYLIIVHSFAPFPILFYGIFIAIISSTYQKVYKFLRNRTTTFKRFKELESTCKPLEIALKRQIESYIKNESSELLQRTKDPLFRESSKATFIENYSFLKEVYGKIGYVPDLFLFLEKSKSIIKGFYVEETNDNKFDLEKENQILNQIKSSKNSLRKKPNKILTPIHRARKQIIKNAQKITKRKNLQMKERRIRIQPQKINWEELNRHKNNIGLVGEELVLLNEKNKLIELEMYEYLLKLEHVSKTKGDGLGYDIISFDEEENQIFIEVKATTNNLLSDIFFTSNELRQMDELGEYYYLYRVYGLDLESKTCEIEIFKGADTVKEYFEFYTESVRAKIKKDKKPGKNNV
ncbi:MAG: DUF3883 domain-containing protein [Bacteroidia bacterium]